MTKKELMDRYKFLNNTRTSLTDVNGPIEETYDQYIRVLNEMNKIADRVIEIEEEENV